MFSIILCTRNRASRLTAALDAIVVAMKASTWPCELIVVDNGSTDQTATVLADWISRQEVPARSIVEPVAGLSRARNAGVRVAGGDVIIMTDDDCIMSPDYMVQVRELYWQEAVIGGAVYKGDPEDKPVSILSDHLERNYDGRRKPSGFVIGANMTFSRSVFDRIGPFDEQLGAGTRFAGGEDSDFIFRAWRAGIPVKYRPQIFVHHFHGRRTKEEVDKLVHGYALADGAIYAKHFLTLRPLRYLAIAAKMGRFRDIRLALQGMAMSLW